MTYELRGYYKATLMSYPFNDKADYMYYRQKLKKASNELLQQARGVIGSTFRDEEHMIQTFRVTVEKRAVKMLRNLGMGVVAYDADETFTWMTYIYTLLKLKVIKNDEFNGWCLVNLAKNEIITKL